MRTKVFTVIFHDYDVENHYFFEGPIKSYKDFQQLCDELLPKAGFKAFLKNKSKGHKVYWNDVVEMLVSLLDEQGYQRVYLDGFEIGNYSQINERVGFSGPLINKHNKMLDKKRMQDLFSNKPLKKKPIQIIK